MIEAGRNNCMYYKMRGRTYAVAKVIMIRRFMVWITWAARARRSPELTVNIKDNARNTVNLHGSHASFSTIFVKVTDE